MKLISEKISTLLYIGRIILTTVLAVFYYNNLKVKSTLQSTCAGGLAQNDNVLLDILDIETGVRGYIISEMMFI
jgi:CHASE3 domain sensor protein